MLIAWFGFLFLIFIMLALDLGVFHRQAHVIKVKEALLWSAIWFSIGISFSVFVYFAYEYKLLGLGLDVDAVDGLVNNGSNALQKYLTGYVVEKSLSVDNIFVIAMIFNFLAVPQIYQHRVLYWGVLGALILRGAMIGIGAQLIAEFHWILYFFAVFLIFTAVKMLFINTDQHADPNQNFVIRLTRKFFSVSTNFYGEKFFIKSEDFLKSEPNNSTKKINSKYVLTPLALALIMVETTDLIFAVDSIPAIFAITADPFLVFTSNVFAILGLRSLYFALSDLVNKFVHLKLSLALVLLLVGLKMIFADWLKLTLGNHFNLYLLTAIIIILAGGVLTSIIADKRKN